MPVLQCTDSVFCVVQEEGKAEGGTQEGRGSRGENKAALETDQQLRSAAKYVGVAAVYVGTAARDWWEWYCAVSWHRESSYCCAIGCFIDSSTLLSCKCYQSYRGSPAC